jgi:probable rRNA maturation factor
MDPSSRRTISIVNRSGRRAPTGVIRTALEAVFSQHPTRTGEVSVLLTDDAEIQDLNLQFRGSDEATDVLTFPADHPMLLGDIAISVPYAERQAAARGVGIAQEIGFLAIHGGLHLLGFDDESERERAQMVGLMNQAAIAAGLQPDEAWASILHGAAK